LAFVQNPDNFDFARNLDFDSETSIR